MSDINYKESRDKSMEYRLCVSVNEKREKSAFAFFNQQDFCVYRRVIDCTEPDAELEYVHVCALALAYFRKNMRNRYYTEHFSELLDEDRCRVLCPVRGLVDAFFEYRENSCPIPDSYAALAEQFDIPTVIFELSESSRLQSVTEKLI